MPWVRGVCSSSGKCVNQNAVCFDSFQCNFEGFNCRSNVTECVDRYERLMLDHNNLVREYNDLLDTHNRLARDHNTLISDHRDLLDTHNRLVRDHNTLTSEHRDLRANHSELMDQHRRDLEITLQLQRDLDDVEGCLMLAWTLEDAKACTP